MKKTLVLFCLFLLVSSLLVAQKPAANAALPVSLPVDSITHLITYEGVFETPGTTPEVLYRRMMDWFRTTYKNPTEVIRENDSIKCKVVGKPRFKIYNPADKSGTKTDAGLIQYTITLAARNGRFRYELTEFTWKQASVYPCERWMDTKAQMYTPVYNDYLVQLNQEANRIINELKTALTHEKPVKNKDDW